MTSKRKMHEVRIAGPFLRSWGGGSQTLAQFPAFRGPTPEVQRSSRPMFR